MENIHIKIVKGLENNPDAMVIRKSVFIEEQGFKNEFDDIDKNAWQAVLFIDNKPAATGRAFGIDGVAHIGRIAVLKEFRKRHLGEQIVTALEKTSKNHGYHKCELSAQTRVKGFYEKLGYCAEGKEYLDEFCPHIKMTKSISDY